jgi:hypothetical protein
VEYVNEGGSAEIVLSWITPSTPSLAVLSSSYLTSYSCLVPGFYITQGLTLYESIGSVFFQLYLTSPPAYNVVITLSGNGLLLSICSVTFTSQNWNVSVDGYAFPDPNDETGLGTQAYIISGSSNSSDTNYHNLAEVAIVELIAAISSNAEVDLGPYIVTFDNLR